MRDRLRSQRRAQVQLVDVVMTFFILVTIMALAPILFTFTGMIGPNADNFSALLLELALPLLILGMIISVGVSARRGT